MSSTARNATTESGEMVSLSERMGLMQALRIGFALSVLAAGAFAERIVGASLTDLVVVTGGYLALAGATEALRRLGRGRGLALVSGMLLVDGVYLAWIMYSTGGTQSPLRFLVYVHVIAVTLLASYRTGLKVTAWHTLLYFCVFYAQAAEILEPTESVAGALPGTDSLFQRLSIFNVAAIWIVAIATSVFSALNERELRRRKNDLEALAEMASSLENATKPAAVAELLLATVTETFGFHRGVVLASFDSDPEVMAYKGPNPAVESIPGVDPVIQNAWSMRETLLIGQLDVDSNRRLALLLPFGRNLVVVPMIAEGAAVGALVVEHTGGKIERSVVAMLEQLTSHAALALRNAWLLEQVQRMAETDGLTGIANRRSFEEVLERELSRATRNGEQVTLMMIDVDHFKKFNDTYGHQAGDDVLRGVANALTDKCRDFDIPARYGGEEFAVILPSCSVRESLAVTERIRKGISAVDAVAQITASAGIATYPEHAADMSSLIKAADEALYESKRAGRDRVTRSRRVAASEPAVSARSDPA